VHAALENGAGKGWEPEEYIMRTLIILLGLGFALAVVSRSQMKSVPPEENGVPVQTAADEKLLLGRAEELAAQISADPRVKELFDKSFFKYLSLARTGEVLAGLYRSGGKVTAVRLEEMDTPFSAHFVFETEKGLSLPVVLSVSRETGKISSMFFRPTHKRNMSLAAVREKFSALPGRAGFLAVKLNESGPALETLHADDVFAVGAVSKLYILGAALAEEYPWKKIFTLNAGIKSLPSGSMKDLPDGSPVTLHSAAAAMISGNDDTAADLLAESLGRRKIEALLPALGHSEPGVMKPFLKTADVFRLKSDIGAAIEYMNLSTPEKYRMLERISGGSLSSTEFRPGQFAMESIGWYASPADLCRLMDYFRKKEDRTALGIMGMAAGLEIPRNRFVYAGYKGSSEPGAVSGVWLLKKHNEDWYCLAGSWNSKRDALEPKVFNELMQAAIYALAGQD